MSIVLFMHGRGLCQAEDYVMSIYNGKPGHRWTAQERVVVLLCLLGARLGRVSASEGVMQGRSHQF